jgi:hypothetical protein
MANGVQQNLINHAATQGRGNIQAGGRSLFSFCCPTNAEEARPLRHATEVTINIVTADDRAVANHPLPNTKKCIAIAVGIGTALASFAAAFLYLSISNIQDSMSSPMNTAVGIIGLILSAAALALCITPCVQNYSNSYC